MGSSLEILCSSCHAETVVRREAVYDGFKKLGEEFVCTACGYRYKTEAEVPFKHAERPVVFSEADRPDQLQVFRDEERGGTCRLCRHYLKNPFVQRCALHRKEVEATDTCPSFKPKPQDKTA